MHNDALISLEEHMQWFSSFRENPSREFWVLHQNDKPIGVLNFNDIDKPKMEWGCYLGETSVWPGSGILLEVAALDRAVELQPDGVLAAEVLSFNKSAIGLHRLFEYPKVGSFDGGVRNEETYCKLYYEYPLTLWKQKRASVLSKLPKSLGKLAETIEFREKV